MHDPDSNPYAPPAAELSAASPIPGDSPQEYRIENNVMILPPPFVLPEVCFLTGERQGLRQCEIPLKVMPKWWNYVMPLIMFSTQMIVLAGSMAIQRLQLTAPTWLVPPIAGVLMGVTAPVLIFAGILFVSKKITLIGFRENSDAVFIRRRRYIARVLLFDFIPGSVLTLVWLTGGTRIPLVAITLISFLFVFILTLVVWMRNRKPWSRIGALQKADGSLAVYGLDPSFLAVCRLGLDDSAALPASTRSA
jgi:hypothetical protein